LVVVALPLLAAATCAPESAKPMHCCKNCPMMAKMQGKMKHSGQSAMDTKSGGNAPCCDMKSSQQAPSTEYQAVAPLVLTQPAASNLAVSEVPQVMTVLFAEAAPPPPPDSQARLCTFQN
ncbi:MAG TPA: hypothetical protein VF786_07905, partial [Terriglobales bacterium]